jgi:hypothetical protein
VAYNAVQKTVEYKWIGFISAQQAKAGMDQINAIIKETRASNLLADVSQFKGGAVESAKYVNEVWCEQLKRLGITHVAVNVPESAFGDFSNRMALGERTVTLLKVEKFVSHEDAYKWFNRQN